MDPRTKVVIIGAGPTGLGAAYRLKELGHENFALYEKSPYIGGLASSFKDRQGLHLGHRRARDVLALQILR